MRNRRLTFFLLLALAVPGGVGALPGDRLLVNSPTGLVLRGTPSLSGDRLASLPDGAEVTVMAHGPEDKMLGGRGDWLRVRSGSAEGWLFGGQLATKPQYESSLKRDRPYLTALSRVLFQELPILVVQGRDSLLSSTPRSFPDMRVHRRLKSPNGWTVISVVAKKVNADFDTDADCASFIYAPPYGILIATDAYSASVGPVHSISNSRAIFARGFPAILGYQGRDSDVICLRYWHDQPGTVFDFDTRTWTPLIVDKQGCVSTPGCPCPAR